MQSSLTISEIFYSIQGESTFAGLPCVFIRFSGCNLRCNYCDAAYTWEEGEVSTIEDILAAISTYPSTLVEVTGGEPLQQKECPQLLRRLLETGKTVLLETNGSIAIDPVPPEVTCILDVKCPDSGSANSFHPDNIHKITERVANTPGSCELKFVLSSRDDYLWATEFISDYRLDGLLPILFSPVHDRVTAPKLAQWIMEDGLAVRLQLQLHTILWPDITRGA